MRRRLISPVIPILETKNNLDLAQWAVEAEKAGWGYVYGTYGTVLDEGLLTSKIGQYPG
ncbi:MAG: hypothetical protein ACLR23_14565 [Clostridia bacterium]